MGFFATTETATAESAHRRSPARMPKTAYPRFARLRSGLVYWPM